MKRKLIFLVFSLFLLFSISACKSTSKSNSADINDNPTSKYITYDEDDYEVPEPTDHLDIKVIYDCNNGFKYQSYLSSDSKVIKPSTDPKKIASTFVGWYSDLELTLEYDFDSKQTKETTIYAKYETDFDELQNTIYEKSILSNIKIVSTFSNNSSYDGKAEVVGSGVIFCATDTSYYALTNYHVIYNENKYTFEKYEIYDCYNNEYEGVILESDVNYDLAIVNFSRINTDGQTVKDELKAISFANYLPNENDDIISIGNPKRIINSITYGDFIGMYSYKTDSSVKEKSNINFDVIKHSAKIDTGSSGGMLLDSNLRLAGINFACKLNDKDEFELAYAIPLGKVIEFIVNYEEKA